MTEVTFHGAGSGICSFSGKEAEGFTVTFKDGTVKEAFLSTKAFLQLIRMKTAQKQQKPAATAPPVVEKPVAK